MQMRAMTEQERLHRHEALIRDSFRMQQQSIDDWVRMLVTLGESKEEIEKLLVDLSRWVDHAILETQAGRIPLR